MARYELRWLYYRWPHMNNTQSQAYISCFDGTLITEVDHRAGKNLDSTTRTNLCSCAWIFSGSNVSY